MALGEALPATLGQRSTRLLAWLLIIAGVGALGAGPGGFCCQVCQAWRPLRLQGQVGVSADKPWGRTVLLSLCGRSYKGQRWFHANEGTLMAELGESFPPARHGLPGNGACALQAWLEISRCKACLPGSCLPAKTTFFLSCNGLAGMALCKAGLAGVCCCDCHCIRVCSTWPAWLGGCAAQHPQAGSGAELHASAAEEVIIMLHGFPVVQIVSLASVAVAAPASLITQTSADHSKHPQCT